MACKAIPGNGPRKVHLYPGVRDDPKNSTECSLVHPASALWPSISPQNRCTSQEHLLCAHTCPREVCLLFITTIQKAKPEQFKESSRESWVSRHTERLVGKGRHPKMMVAAYTQSLELVNVCAKFRPTSSGQGVGHCGFSCCPQGLVWLEVSV